MGTVRLLLLRLPGREGHVDDPVGLAEVLGQLAGLDAFVQPGRSLGLGLGPETDRGEEKKGLLPCRNSFF